MLRLSLFFSNVKFIKKFFSIAYLSELLLSVCHYPREASSCLSTSFRAVSDILWLSVSFRYLYEPGALLY